MIISGQHVRRRRSITGITISMSWRNAKRKQKNTVFSRNTSFNDAGNRWKTTRNRLSLCLVVFNGSMRRWKSRCWRLLLMEKRFSYAGGESLYFCHAMQLLVYRMPLCTISASTHIPHTHIQLWMTFHDLTSNILEFLSINMHLWMYSSSSGECLIWIWFTLKR